MTMSQKAALAAVMDNPDSDFSGTESELQSDPERSRERELDTEHSHEREPDSGNELDGERAESSTSRAPLLEANSLGLSDTLTPRQTGKVELSRTPFRELKQSTPLPLALCTSSGSKGISAGKSSLLRRPPTDEGDSNSRKKKRFRKSVEQENLFSDHEKFEGDMSTNALLKTLIERLDRQEKQMLQMQKKLDHVTTSCSSSSSGRTPSRSRRKEVPLEVRVS